MLSDDGKVARSDRAIPHEVFDFIKRREGNKLLLPSRKVEGALNPGEDEAMILRKALQLTYHVVGDDVAPGADESHPEAEKWVMR